MTETTQTPAEGALEADLCIEMFRQMVLIRHFEELALKLRLDNQIHGVVHP
jgi:TPP-dependent pyruvate/acetoin dehydrogenase alpha subunit